MRPGQRREPAVPAPDSALGQDEREVRRSDERGELEALRRRGGERAGESAEREPDEPHRAGSRGHLGAGPDLQDELLDDRAETREVQRHEPLAAAQTRLGPLEVVRRTHEPHVPSGATQDAAPPAHHFRARDLPGRDEQDGSAPLPSCGARAHRHLIAGPELSRRYP
jgi:hypothetical protein